MPVAGGVCLTSNKGDFPAENEVAETRIDVISGQTSAGSPVTCILKLSLMNKIFRMFRNCYAAV